MRIAKKIKIGGLWYKILKNYKWGERFDRTAQFDSCLTEIRLGGTDSGGLPLTQQRKEQDFVHEILHGIDHVYNGHKLDEDTTERLSHGLYQVLKDNHLRF